jgi:hypothetical protein
MVDPIIIFEPSSLGVRKKENKFFVYKDKQEERIQAYGEFFYGLWQDALEDGVLGGIRWGIAGCCYQVLFVLSGKAINTTFSLWRLVKKTSILFIDKLIGRKKRPDIAQLQRLRFLLQGFNQSLRSKSTYLYAGTDNCLLVQTCQQLIDSLSNIVLYYDYTSKKSVIARTIDFCSFHNQQELLFLSNLLINSLNEVIKSRSTDEKHHDIIQKVNNVLLILDQLISAIRGVYDQVHIDSGLSATIDIT